MSFRLRLTLLAAVAIALVVVATSTAVLIVARHQLRSQVDSALKSQVVAVEESHHGLFGFRYVLLSSGGDSGEPEPVRHSDHRAGTASRLGLDRQLLRRPAHQRRPRTGVRPDRLGRGRTRRGSVAAGDRSLAEPHQVLDLPHRRCRHRARGRRCSPRRGRGAAADPAAHGSGRERRGDRQPRRTRRGERRRRARPPGRAVQRDARGARAVGGCTAPPGRRRLARAAHAAHRCPHEPRPASRRQACRPTRRSAPWTSRASSSTA